MPPSAIYRSNLLGVVLTGMGSDGARADRRRSPAPAATCSPQDEASSVVWGMPGAVVAAGAAFEVLPIEEIGPRMTRMLGGRK